MKVKHEIGRYETKRITVSDGGDLKTLLEAVQIDSNFSDTYHK